MQVRPTLACFPGEKIRSVRATVGCRKCCLYTYCLDSLPYRCCELLTGNSPACSFVLSCAINTTGRDLFLPMRRGRRRTSATRSTTPPQAHTTGLWPQEDRELIRTPMTSMALTRLRSHEGSSRARSRAQSRALLCQSFETS